MKRPTVIIVASASIAGLLLLAGGWFALNWTLSTFFKTTKFHNELPYQIRLLCADDPMYPGPGETTDAMVDFSDSEGNIHCGIYKPDGVVYAGCLVFTEAEVNGRKPIQIDAATVDSNMSEDQCLKPLFGK